MMKKIIVIAILFLGCFNSTFAQPSYEVIEQKLPYNHWAISFTTDIIGLGEDFVLYHWEKYIENHKGQTYLTSSKEGNIELRSEKVKFPLLDNEEVEMYTRLSPNSSETGVLLTIWIKMKDRNYFSSKTHPNKAKEIKNWLLKFNQNLESLNEKIIHN